jgi:hypothetical protein
MREENNLIHVNQVELREILIQSGYLEYSIKSYINGYLDCLYEIPGVSQNGNGVVIQTATEPASGSTPFVHTGSINLSGYTFDLTGGNGLMNNRLYTHLLISSAVDAPNQTLVSGNDSIVVELKFIDPVIQYARGYFGEQSYQLEESVDLSDNIDFPSGLLNLENVTMNLDITNYVGVDARILFHDLANINTQTGHEVTMAHVPLYQPINLTRAFDQSGNVLPTTVSFNMNQSNSNIDAFIENLPNFILMNADVIINPLGDISDGNDFIYTAQTLDAELSLDVPLNIGMQNLQFKDTLDIASTIELKADGHIYLHVDNWFPFSATCDAYLINESGHLINVLCKNQSVQEATETDVQGVTIPMHSIIDVPVNESLIQAFNPDNKIVIRLTMNTPDLNAPVGLYQSYRMDFKSSRMVLFNGSIDMMSKPHTIGFDQLKYFLLVAFGILSQFIASSQTPAMLLLTPDSSYKQKDGLFRFYSEGAIGSNVLDNHFMKKSFFGGHIERDHIAGLKEDMTDRNRAGFLMNAGLDVYNLKDTLFNRPHWGLRVGLSTNYHATMSFSKDMFSLIYQGNKGYLNDTASLGPFYFQYQSWQKVGLGIFNKHTLSSVSISLVKDRVIIHFFLTR